MMNRRALVLGVTGGIGSGKSEVSRILCQLGAFVISADDLARQLMETHPALKRQITRWFGADAYTGDGQLNRSKLAGEIFSKPERRRLLDSLVHPYVLRKLRQMIREYRHRYPIIVIEAALIYESGAERLMDFVVVVDAKRAIRIRRVMKRDGVTRAEVLRRAGAQMPQREKVRRADFVILNNSNPRSLRKKVLFLFHLLLQLSRA